MNPLPIPLRRLFARLALVLAAAAGFAAPRAGAQVYVYNGITVVRTVPAARQPLFVNSGLVVSPALNAPTLIRIIVRRQGTITHNVLALNPLAKTATFTYGSNTAHPSVATGTCTITSTGAGQGTGSTVTISLTAGSPTGTMLFRIQPGAVNVTSSLKFKSPTFTSKEHFIGLIVPPVIH